MEGTFHYNWSEYEDMDDKKVVLIARKGNSLALDYLINKYKKLVETISRGYFLIGGDRDDIIQEGMIGLLKGFRDFDEENGTPFTYFIEICIKRQIITAINRAKRKKHTPLNEYISLNKKVWYEDSDRTLIETLQGDKVLDPMESYIRDEEIQSFKGEVSKSLSPLELTILINFLAGETYEEISIKLNKDQKCIDNALQRARKKLIQGFHNKY